MALGVPVVASNAGALPEVVGDAGLLVDALDAPGLAAALERVCGDAEAASRMRDAGIARARQFSWPQSAGALIDAYTEARVRRASARRARQGLRP